MGKVKYENRAMQMVQNANIGIDSKKETEVEKPKFVEVEEIPIEKVKTKEAEKTDKPEKRPTIKKEKKVEKKSEAVTEEPKVVAEPVAVQGEYISEELAKNKEERVLLNLQIYDDFKDFVRGEANFMNISMQDYVASLIIKHQELPTLGRKESIAVSKKIKAEMSGPKSLSHYAIPESISEMFTEQAQRNRMKKTEYLNYILYCEYESE